MDDLIERLRALSRHEHSDMTIGDEAADALEAAHAEREVIVAEALKYSGKSGRLEAKVDRLTEALRVLADAFESRMADDENPDWHECWNNARALLREQENK